VQESPKRVVPGDRSAARQRMPSALTKSGPATSPLLTTKIAPA